MLLHFYLHDSYGKREPVVTRDDKVPLNSEACDNINKQRTDLLFFSCATADKQSQSFPWGSLSFL